MTSAVYRGRKTSNQTNISFSDAGMLSIYLVYCKNFNTKAIAVTTLEFKQGGIMGTSLYKSDPKFASWGNLGLV